MTFFKGVEKKVIRSEHLEGPVLFNYPQAFWRACEFYLKKNVYEPNKICKSKVGSWRVTFQEIHKDPENKNIQFSSNSGLITSADYRMMFITAYMKGEGYIFNDLFSNQTFIVFDDDKADEVSENLNKTCQGRSAKGFLLEWHRKANEYEDTKIHMESLIWGLTKSILECDKKAKKEEAEEWITNRIIEGVESGKYNYSTNRVDVLRQFLTMWKCRNVTQHMGK
jgi:hypothetical protein